MGTKYKLLLIIVICTLLSISCIPRGGETQSPASNDSIETRHDVSDSIKEHLIIQDTLTNGLNYKIDSLTNELANAKQEIGNLHSKIKGLQKPSLVLCFLCVIAIILSIFSIVLLYRKTKRKVDSIEVSEILNSKIKSFNLPLNLGPRLTRLEQESKIGLNKDNSGHVSQLRLESIEKRLAKLESTNNSNREKRYAESLNTQKDTPLYEENSNSIQEESGSSLKKTLEKVLYTGINSENYFVDFYNSQQESCVYKIMCETEDKGIFTLISLDKIQSSNGWQTVVEYETNGECTIEEAQNFTLIDYGKCEKIEDNTWKVIENLKIKISR